MKTIISEKRLRLMLEQMLLESPAPDESDSTYNAAVKFHEMVKRQDVVIDKKEFASASTVFATFFNNIINPEIVSKLGNPASLERYLLGLRGKNFALLAYNASKTGTTTAAQTERERGQDIIDDPNSRSIAGTNVSVRETTIQHPVFYLDPSVVASSQAQKYILEAIISANAGAIGNFYEQFSSQVILPEFSDSVTNTTYSNAYNLNSSRVFPSNMPSVDLYLGDQPPHQLNLTALIQAASQGDTIIIPGVCLSGKCSTGNQIYSKLEGLKIIKVFAQLLRPNSSGYGDASQVIDLFNAVLGDKKLAMNYSFSTGGLKSPAKTTAEFGEFGDVSGAGTTSENPLNVIRLNINLTAHSDVGAKLLHAVDISDSTPSSTHWNASWLFEGTNPSVTAQELKHTLGIEELKDYVNELSNKIASNVINQLKAELEAGTLISLTKDSNKTTAGNQPSYILGSQNQLSEFIINYATSSAKQRTLSTEEKTTLEISQNKISSINDIIPFAGDDKIYSDNKATIAISGFRGFIGNDDPVYDSKGREIRMFDANNVEIKGNKRNKQDLIKTTRRDKTTLETKLKIWLMPYLDGTSEEFTEFLAFIKSNCILGMTINAQADPKYYENYAEDLSARPTAESVPGLTCYLSKEALITLSRDISLDTSGNQVITWKITNKDDLELASIKKFRVQKLSENGEVVTDATGAIVMEDKIDFFEKKSTNWSGTSSLLGNPALTTVATFFPAVNAGNVSQIVRSSNQKEADFVNALAKVYTASVFNALSPYKPVTLPSRTRINSPNSGTISLVKKPGSSKTFVEDSEGTTLFGQEQTFGQALQVISSVSEQIRSVMNTAHIDEPSIKRLARGFASVVLDNFPENYQSIEPRPFRADLNNPEEIYQYGMMQCTNFIAATTKSVFESGDESEESLRAALLGCLSIRTTAQFRRYLVSSLNHHKPEDHTPPPEWADQLLGDRYTGELPGILPESLLRTETLEIFNVVIATLKFVDGLSSISLPVYRELTKLILDIKNKLIQEFSKYSSKIAAESRLFKNILQDIMEATEKKQKITRKPKKIYMSEKLIERKLSKKRKSVKRK